MAAGDGDGWVTCRCGQRHWGLHGAAGLLLVTTDGRVLLHQRSPGTHHANTWSLPGGARHRDETAEQAAIREAVEEVGLDPSLVEVVGFAGDDHGPWSFVTVLATVAQPVLVGRRAGRPPP